MRKIINLAVAATLMLAPGGNAYAAEFTKGKFKKIDERAGKVTVTQVK